MLLRRPVRFAFVVLAATLAAGHPAPSGNNEIVLLHCDESGDGLVLTGAMISPGKYRRPARASEQDSLQMELLNATGGTLASQRVPDPRRIFPGPMPTVFSFGKVAGVSSGFSIRLPWTDLARQLRIRDGQDRLLLQEEISEGFVREARSQYELTRGDMARQAERLKRRPNPSPAAISSIADRQEPSQGDAVWLRSAEQLQAARRFLDQQDRAGSSDQPEQTGLITVSVHIVDQAGKPVLKAGIVAIEKKTGKILAGVDADADGRARIRAVETGTRLYVFPPYQAAGSPLLYARQIIEPDLSGKTSLDLVLEPGVFVSGKAVRSDGVNASNYGVTAVDVATSEAIEYARTAANGTYSMRVPPGRYRFYVGPKPEARLLVSDPVQLVGEVSTQDFTVILQPLDAISGKVVSPKGQAIPGARLALYDAAANVIQTLTSAPDGSFSGNAPRDGFIFVYPNSSTAFQALTLNTTELPASRQIVLPELPAIQPPYPDKPQLGLVYGDPGDPTRVNMVLIGDGFTDIEESFTDLNGNGLWDGDIYLDENGNGEYDAGETFFNRNGISGYQAPEPFVDANGDGTRNSNEQAILDRNVLDYVRVLLGTSPWPDMLSRINFWRIRTVSNQACGSFKEFGITRDTVLNTSYGVKSTGYIISLNNTKATQMVQALIPEYDHIISISNSPLAVGRANANLGGNLRLKGGDYDNLSTVTTHELGHAVGLLGDEYSDQTIIDTSFIYKGSEPTQANLSTIPFGSLTKWAMELDGSVPYPTPQDLPGAGIFEGGSYSYRGMYRPEFNCMMRSNTPRFCVVCIREMRSQIIDRSSTNSLSFPLLVFNDDAAQGERLLTAFSALNTDPGKPLALGFSATNESGKLFNGRGIVNPALRILAPLQQNAEVDRQLFGLQWPLNGWVEANANGPVKGFYVISDADFAEKLDGAVANPDAAADLALTYMRQEGGARSFFSVVNPSSRTSSTSLGYYDAAGIAVSPAETRSLLSKGQIFQEAPIGTRWIRVRSTSNPPVELQAAGFTYDSRTLTAQSAVPLNAPTDRLVLPHFAVGGGYETRMVVDSLNAVNLNIEAHRSDGSLIATVRRVLDPAQQFSDSVRTLFGLQPEPDILVGYLSISEANNRPGGLQGVTALTHFTFGTESAAISQAERTPRTTLTFSHVANDVPAGKGKTYLTGITLLNPGSDDATCQIRVYDQAGKLMVERTMLLKAGGKVSRVLSGDPEVSAFFPRPLVAGSGYIVVTSSRPIYGFELFFTNDLTQLAAVPAQ